jgi:PST family polysaccharide transporter
MGTYAASRGITILALLVLARLLEPTDFGLAALATVIMLSLSLLNDLGLGGTLIQRRDLDRRAMGTLLTLMLLTSLVLALVLVAFAPLAASIFDQPRLPGLLMVLAGFISFNGAAWFHDALLQRELEFGRRFAAHLAQALTYATVAIVLAAVGAGVWSIVIGQVTGMLAHLALLLSLVPYRVRPRFDRATAGDAIGTGRGFLAQGYLAFVENTVDYLVIGRVLGAAQLGFYSMAFRMAELPYYAIADPVGKVTFSSFSRMRHQGQDVLAPFLHGLRVVALVACPVGVLLSALAGPFVAVVLGDQWLPMIAPLAVLGVWAALRPVQATLGWYLNSVGRQGLMGALSAIMLSVLVPLLVVAVNIGGIVEVAWAMVAHIVVSVSLLAVAAHRRAGATIARQWLALRPVVLACPAAWVVAWSVVRVTAGQSDVLSLAAGALAGTLAYVTVVSLLAPGAFSDALRGARATVARRAAAPPAV